MGSKGFVFSLIAKRDAAVAAAVRESLSAGASLEGLKQKAGDAQSERAVSRPQKRASQRGKPLRNGQLKCS